MKNAIKEKIYQLLDDISDETILNQVMEDVTFYVSEKDVTHDLTQEQMNELDLSIKEADDGKTIPWNDFKNEMSAWKEK